MLFSLHDHDWQTTASYLQACMILSTAHLHSFFPLAEAAQDHQEIGIEYATQRPKLSPMSSHGFPKRRPPAPGIVSA